jgi:Putative transposase, YhgA-like/Domain of unknown function (DUF4351)
MAKTQPHDALFKSAFTEVEHAAAHLRVILPAELCARIDFTKLAVVPGSFVDANLRFRHTDVLYRAVIGGKEALIYLLHEHQSRVEALMGFRVLRYEVRIWDHYIAAHPQTKKLPPILAVVVYHGETGWYAATSFEDLLDVGDEDRAAVGPYVPRFQFVLDDLTVSSDAELRSRPMSAFARLVLWLLKHAREPGHILGGLEPWAAVIGELLRAPNGQAAFEKLIRYILEVNREVSPGELQGLMAKAVGSDAEEAVVSVIERMLKQERAQGRVQGHAQGARELFLKQLEARFGSVPDDTRARIEGASTVELEAWALRVLTAKSLAEVVDEPRRTRSRSRR